MTFLNKKNIFLVDGIGALVSTLFLGVLLPALKAWIGMPVQMLYILAGIAALFAVYSLSCFKFVDHSNTRWLKVIMTGNLLYCGLTATIVAQRFSELTLLGKSYFIGEIFVILGVVFVERKVLNNPT